MSDDKLMDIDSNQNNDDNEYEDVCYICRRPEHVAGKMIHIPNNICICSIAYSNNNISWNAPKHL